MVVSFLNELQALGLWSDEIVTFDGGFGFSMKEVVCLASFVIILMNIWFVLKRLFKKVV